MAKEGLTGKLAVILHADVAGSTELVHQNEQLAHQRIQDTFHRFGETISKYHGHVRELRGDALLAEFERASDAVTAALAFQVGETDYNIRLNDNIQPTVRVGVAMGEVIIADDTITGTGVVLAQRLEQLSKPGGVVIQGAAYETIPGRFPFEYEDLGRHDVKGFVQPVRVYSASLKIDTDIPQPGPRDYGNRNTIVAIAAVAFIVIGTALMWIKPWETREEPASEARMAFPLPDKPSIAVLPFTNMSGDADQEYFVDGMTEDLITDLSKIAGLFVIARNSTFSYKGKSVKVGQVAEELGVRYVLEGSVRRAGGQVRINAQLIDATTGGHLWAERYDGSLADIFALQDQVAAKIVEAMSVTLTPQEQEDLESLGTSNAAAHDAYLQGLSFYLRNTPADNAKAEPHFKRAVELDPDFKRAYTALAKVYHKGEDPEFSRALGIYWRKTIFLAHKNLAKSVGANIAGVHVVLARMALNKHQLSVALQEADKALKLNTNDVDALKVKAKTLIYSGQYVEGQGLANRIIRLDPAVLAEPAYIIGLSQFALGNYSKAAEHAEQATENDPATRAYALLLAAAYGKLGMEKEAREALAKYRVSWRWPFWIAAAVYQYPFQDGIILRHLANGFKAAGLAERPPSRYLKLVGETRLSGQEIKALLFGHTVRGQGFRSGLAWEQKRTAEGRFSHSGQSIYTGISHAKEEGKSWIEDDRLCDHWSELGDEITICVLIFRDLDRGPSDFYMMTDQGPHPFRVLN